MGVYMYMHVSMYIHAYGYICTCIQNLREVLACRSTTAKQVAIQIQQRTTMSRGASSGESFSNSTPTTAELEAAALHYMRTGESFKPVDERTMVEVAEQLRLESLGLSACGACVGCVADQDCRLAAVRQAARDGKSGAQWAQQGGELVGRTFEVCQHC
jgi:hypothetical protein